MIGSKTNHNNMLYFHKAVGCEKELREVVKIIFLILRFHFYLTNHASVLIIERSTNKNRGLSKHPKFVASVILK